MFYYNFFSFAICALPLRSFVAKDECLSVLTAVGPELQCQLLKLVASVAYVTVVSTHMYTTKLDNRSAIPDTRHSHPFSLHRMGSARQYSPQRHQTPTINDCTSLYVTVCHCTSLCGSHDESITKTDARHLADHRSLAVTSARWRRLQG